MTETGFGELPASAAWRHVVARDGFEAVFIQRTRGGWRFQGHSTAVDAGRPWTVQYDVTVDSAWRTRRAEIWSWSETGHCHRSVEADGTGRWHVDGAPAPALDGCLDVDLEASACTNTFPVHRLAMVPDQSYDAPATYVRAANLDIERLEQRYTSRGAGIFDYEAPASDFRCQLQYDPSGLVVDYPGIAVRVH